MEYCLVECSNERAMRNWTQGLIFPIQHMDPDIVDIITEQSIKKVPQKDHTQILLLMLSKKTCILKVLLFCGAQNNLLVDNFTLLHKRTCTFFERPAFCTAQSIGWLVVLLRTILVN